MYNAPSYWRCLAIVGMVAINRDAMGRVYAGLANCGMAVRRFFVGPMGWIGVPKSLSLPADLVTGNVSMTR